MEITPSEIKDAYKNAFQISWLHGIFDWFGMGVFRLTNLNYNELDYDILHEVVLIDETDRMEWIYNEQKKFTCADFTYSLMGAIHKHEETAGMPIFVTWVIVPTDDYTLVKYKPSFTIGGLAGHSLASFYDAGIVHILEPQTDEVFLPPEGWQLYLLNG